MKDAIVLSISAARALPPDTLELKTAERIDGTFKEATPQGLLMEAAG